MARFSGKIGYKVSIESAPDVWTDDIVEKQHYGDILKDAKRWNGSPEVNDTLRLTDKISIVANSFALENIGAMKYVIKNGSKWKIVTVEVNRPRIILTLGGIYNGN